MFSWQLLRDKGRPNFRTYYTKVAKAEALPDRKVRFDLDRRQRPRAAADPRADAGAGQARGQSGHVRGDDIRADRSAAAPTRSARSTPAAASPSSAIPTTGDAISRSSAGFWNFDEVRFDFYRDANSHFEAFKKGLYDLRVEHDPSKWETAYDVPAVRDGRIVKEAFPNGMPKQLSGLVFNTRRPIFADIRVREALGLLFDFEWLNHNFFFDRYQRSASYFEGSELSARGRAADARERALLAPFPDAVRPDFMDGQWQPPVTDGTGRDRTTLKRALALLQAAGYDLDGTVLRERATRQAVHLRDHGHHQGPGANRAWRSRGTSSAPVSQFASGWSTPCNTTGGDSRTITT